jgi:hypothetical protein
MCRGRLCDETNPAAAVEAQRLNAMLFANLCSGLIQRGDPFHNRNFSLIGSGYL